MCDPETLWVPCRSDLRWSFSKVLSPSPSPLEETGMTSCPSVTEEQPPYLCVCISSLHPCACPACCCLFVECTCIESSFVFRDHVNISTAPSAVLPLSLILFQMTQSVKSASWTCYSSSVSDPGTSAQQPNIDDVISALVIWACSRRKCGGRDQVFRGTGRRR